MISLVVGDCLGLDLSVEIVEERDALAVLEGALEETDKGPPIKVVSIRRGDCLGWAWTILGFLHLALLDTSWINLEDLRLPEGVVKEPPLLAARISLFERRRRILSCSYLIPVEAIIKEEMLQE